MTCTSQEPLVTQFFLCSQVLCWTLDTCTALPVHFCKIPTWDDRVNCSLAFLCSMFLLMHKLHYTKYSAVGRKQEGRGSGETILVPAPSGCYIQSPHSLNTSFFGSVILSKCWDFSFRKNSICHTFTVCRVLPNSI